MAAGGTPTLLRAIGSSPATKLVVMVEFSTRGKAKEFYYDPNDPFKRVLWLRQLIFKNNTALFERSGCPSEFFWHER
jgi:hypothetical protein